MATVAELLADTDADRQYLVEVSVYVPAGVNANLNPEEQTFYFSERGYATDDTSAVLPQQLFEARIMTGLSISRSMYRPGGHIGGATVPNFGEIVLAAPYDGYQSEFVTIRPWDFLRRCAADGRRVRILAVGRLRSGDEVTYDTASASPIFDGTMAGDLLVNDQEIRIRLRDDLYKLEVPAQPNYYRGMGQAINLDGVDDYGQSGVIASAQDHTVEFWFRCKGRNTSGNNQVVFVWGNTFSVAGVDVYCQILEQSGGALQVVAHRSSSTTAGVTVDGIDFRDGVWRHIAWSITPGANGLNVYIDGELVGTTTPGVFAANAAAFLTVGRPIAIAGNYAYGEIDEIRVWNYVRSNQEILDNMFREIPVNESGLIHYYTCNEYSGTNVPDQVLTGGVNITLTGATWAPTFSGLVDLAGAVRPRALGRVRHAYAYPVDPKGVRFSWHDADGIGRSGPIDAVYEGGSRLTLTTDYSVDYLRGIITLVAATDRKITVDCWGEGPFPGSLSFDGVDDLVAGTVIPCSPGSLTIEAWVKRSKDITANAAVAGWGFGAGVVAGVRGLIVANAGTNLVTMSVRNDAGTAYNVASADQIPAAWTHIAGVLDTSAGELRIYVNGELAATPVAVAGTFNTVRTDFAAGRSSAAATFYFPGCIGEIRAWQGVRTQDEIRALMVRRPLQAEIANLITYWPMSDNAGSTVSGNPETPGELLRPWYIREINLSFDGATTFVDCGTSSTYNFTSGAFTVEAWVNPAATGTRMIAARGTAATSGWDFGINGSSQLQFRTHQAGATQTSLSTALTLNRWSHVAAVRSGTSVSLYIDGVLSMSSSGSHTNPATHAGNLNIGRLPAGSSYWSGRMCEVRIWNAARTANEIAANMTVPQVGYDVNRHGQWRLDEGSGTVAYNTGCAAVANGTITAGTWRTLRGAITGATWTGGPCSPALLSRHLATGTAEVDESLVDDTSVRTAHGLLPYDAGIFVVDEISALDSLTDLLGFEHWFGFTRARLFEINRFPPSDTTVALDITDAIRMDAMLPVPASPPYWRILVGYARNQTVQGGGDLAGIISTEPENYSFCTTEWRYAKKEDVSIKTAYPQAGTLVVHTPLVNESAANEVAARLLTAFGQQQWIWDIPLRTTPLTLDVGDYVSFSDRFETTSYDTVKELAGYIIGFDELGNDVTVTIWAGLSTLITP